MRRVLIAAAVVLAASRFVFLDADPPLFKRAGDICDEGYWSQQARSRALFGKWFTDDFTQGLAAAPLYTLLSFAAFSACGVSLASARLVSATAGAGCIALVYLIVRRYDRGLAPLAAFILAVNDAFFMYNRVGFPETLVILFVLGQFYFLATPGGSRARFWGGGICFALAVLSKFTAVYFIPVVALYLAARCARREAGPDDILLYLAGALTVAIPAVALYYLPLMPRFEPTLSGLSRAGSTPLRRAPFNLFGLASNHYFSIPSVFLLTIGALAYARRRGFGSFFRTIGITVRATDGLELIGLCWAVGLVIGLMKSNLADRRVCYFIIPLVLFSAMLLGRRGAAALPRGRGITPLACAVFMVPFLNMAHLLIPGHSRSMQVVAGAAMAVTALGACSFRSGAGGPWRRFKSAVELHFADLALCALVAALSLNFALRNGALAAFVHGSPLPAAVPLVVATGIAMAVCAWLLSPRVRGPAAWCGIYIGLCGALVLSSLGAATFTARDASRAMGRICMEGERIIGPEGHELSFENRLIPVLWTPNWREFASLNRGVMAHGRPRWYLRVTSHEGKATHLEDVWPTPRQVGERLEYTDTISLWPVFGKPRVVLDLYGIEYSKKEETDDGTPPRYGAERARSL